MDGHGEFPDLHPDLSQNLCWWMILNTGWILNSSNWYWTDTESIISVLYYINVYFLKCQRSFYHAFLKFRFNKPWPGPRIRTSRQSELGLALWVLLNVCVGPTLRWKALLEGNGCAKQHSVYSCLFSVACVFCVFLLFIFKRSKLWLYKHFGSGDCEFACKKVPVTLCATLYHTVGTLKTSLMSRFKHFKH